ncbi:MAG TPA: AMP-binding protein [Candidatus Baltobacteraceae bacterium]|nr:AMP-binding protein [Candidatus Baltobacteraceae bacterium]
MDGSAVWRPGERQIAEANFTNFLARCGTDSYAELTAQVAQDIRPLNERVIEALGLHWDRPYSALLDLSRGKPFAHWFVGGAMNAAANCLDRQIALGRGETTALIAESDDQSIRSYSFRELRNEVMRLAEGLHSLGVRPGDAIAIFMPLVAETAIALLAIGYVGAVAVPAFSGYGEQALATRLIDARAQVLLTVDGTLRRGKRVSMKETADKAVALAPEVRHVVVLRRLGLDVAWDAQRDVDWEILVGSQSSEGTYERTAASDPYLLLYTSGSTGKPKGVVHAHAGFPLKVMIDQYLCFDVKPGDRMLWFTDMGWMMGPFLVLGALGLGASIVLFDGTPDYPTPDRLWSVCARHGVTHLGVAPTAIRSLMTLGDEHPRKHDLSCLRILGSTGEPWNTQPYRWFSEVVGGGRVPIINYSGGTEIGGGILGCFPTMPLAANSFHGPIPGMVADVYDVEGRSVRGIVGELVLREPWIGMTQSFWKSRDERDDQRYLATYWERFPGVWVHGDWALIEASPSSDDPDFWYIRGRSDDTINIAGKRVGPAEFESALVADPAVKEAAAIAIPDEIKGDVVVCLVVALSREMEGEEVRARLFRRIDSSLGKSLRPKAIRFVDDLPKTRNLKVMRRLARGTYLGLETLGDLSALENPSSLDAIAKHR